MKKLVKITVAKVSEQTENGNFIHTLKTEGKEIEFLGTKMQQRGETFLVALATALPVDHTGEIDLGNFDVVEKTKELVSERSGELETFTFKWLYPKR